MVKKIELEIEHFITLRWLKNRIRTLHHFEMAPTLWLLELYIHVHGPFRIRGTTRGRPVPDERQRDIFFI